MACRIADSVFLFTGPNQRPIENQKFACHHSPGIYKLKWDALQLKGIKHRKCSVSMKRTKLIQAVAVPVAPASAEDAKYRKQLAESYGFKKIGEPLPDNVTLRDVIDTLPKKVFEIDEVKAWKSVLISITSYSLGLFMIAKAPWYLLPLAWAWTGTAVTGFFVIGHDCAHKSFSKNKLLEDIVGTLAFLPLVYPYEPWRFKHDRHHAKTNMLAEDTAWHPVWKQEFDSSPLLRKALVYGLGPFRTFMSISHWLIWHFDLKKFRPNEVKRVKISLACVFAFMAIGWPLIIYKTGIVGWIKFWLMPWLGYHFWMSTFTMVHHTAPHIPFKNSDEWNAAQAQLSGTVHCDYPKWIEILCHDINVHIPHHVSSKIPSYNLRAAHKSIQENWGKYLNEATWNWRLMKTIMTMCHVYDKEQNYVGFDELAPEDSQPIKFLKTSEGMAGKRSASDDVASKLRERRLAKKQKAGPPQEKMTELVVARPMTERLPENRGDKMPMEVQPIKELPPKEKLLGSAIAAGSRPTAPQVAMGPASGQVSRKPLLVIPANPLVRSTSAGGASSSGAPGQSQTQPAQELPGRAGKQGDRLAAKGLNPTGKKADDHPCFKRHVALMRKYYESEKTEHVLVSKNRSQANWANFAEEMVVQTGIVMIRAREEMIAAAKDVELNKKKAAELGKKVEELLSTAGQMKDLADQRRIEQEQAEARLSVVEQEYASSKQELSSAREELVSARMELASVVAKSASVEKELALVKDELSAAKQEVFVKSAAYDQNYRELASAKEQLSVASSEIEALRARVAELQTSLSMAKSAAVEEFMASDTYRDLLEEEYTAAGNDYRELIAEAGLDLAALDAYILTQGDSPEGAAAPHPEGTRDADVTVPDMSDQVLSAETSAEPTHAGPEPPVDDPSTAQEACAEAGASIIPEASPERPAVVKNADTEGVD